MKTTILVAAIAAFPPTLAAILAYIASTRTLRRAVGPSEGVPLVTIVARLDERLERIDQSLSNIAERVARVEGGSELPLRVYLKVERISASLTELAERVARVEVRGS